MSGPIVRSYGIPNWDAIFGNGGKKSKGGKSTSQASTKKKSDAKKGAAKSKKSR